MSPVPGMAHLARPHVPALRTYEPGKPIGEVSRELGLGDPEAIDKLASNENVLGPSPRAVEAMRAAAAEAHLYPDGGAYYLRTALAEAIGVAPENVCPTNGSNEAIELLGHAFLGPDAHVVMSERAFVVYRLVADLFGAPWTAVPMSGFTHDAAAMAAAVTPETRLVFVANPNNPTGTMIDQAAVERFMDGLPDHAIAVFDEAYIDLVPPEQRPDTLRYVREGRNIFVLRTFSKAYGLAGLRIGYVIAPAEGIALLNRVRQPFNTNAMAQAAAIAALGDAAFVEKTRALVAGGLRQLECAFDARGLSYVPSVANFLLVRVGNGRAVFDRLLRSRVIVRPMDGYGLPEFIRVTVGTEAQNRRFLDALDAAIRDDGPRAVDRP